jgi:acetyl esterase/lipase
MKAAGPDVLFHTKPSNMFCLTGDGRLCAYAKIPQEGKVALGDPPADVKEMEAALKAAGKTAEFVIYPGAPHAFFVDYRPSYRDEAAKDAWGRCVVWFNKYLKG